MNQPSPPIGSVFALHFQRMLERVIVVRPNELMSLLLAFAYFFCLLCGYYMLRPVREDMAIVAGVDNIQWLFTATFFVMLAFVPLYAAGAARFRRGVFLTRVYITVTTSIVLFFLLFKAWPENAWLARAFYVWVSVFNLFAISAFWSFMVDLFDPGQSKRLFGFIAAGGSTGAMVGPGLTALLAVPLGPVNLLPISALLFALAVWCIRSLDARGRVGRPMHEERDGAPLGGRIWAGLELVLKSRYLLGICLLILLYTTLSTFLYFEQAHIVAANIDDSARRTALFASMDWGVNVLAVITQTFVTGRLAARFGLTVTLVIVPVLTAVGFAMLGFMPNLEVLVAFQILRRASEYAIMRPAREMLFTVVDRETKYKAKNFIDTVVYRGGDALSGWAFTLLLTLGLGLSSIAFVAVPIAMIWGAVAYRLGRWSTRETPAGRPVEETP